MLILENDCKWCTLMIIFQLHSVVMLYLLPEHERPSGICGLQVQVLPACLSASFFETPIMCFSKLHTAWVSSFNANDTLGQECPDGADGTKNGEQDEQGPQEHSLPRRYILPVELEVEGYRKYDRDEGAQRGA